MDLKKSNWKKVKLDDVVINKKITADARNCGLNKYIAGDHMNTEDLHLRRFGIIGDSYLGPAFHRKFEKGDILYGSRRTYLKKVAIADFDGITSNTTFVLTEKAEKVVPGLIPYLMLSDKFTEHSIMHSKGSVNPYINFKDIGQFEFLLPPKEQQTKLVKLLQACDEVVERYNSILSKLKKVNERYIASIIELNTNLVTLNEVSRISYGMGVPPKADVNGTPVIRATNIKRGNIVSNDLLKVNQLDVLESKRVLLEDGDIIVVRSGAYTGDVGYIDSDWSGSLAGYDLVVKLDRKVANPLFIKEYLLSEKCQAYFKSESTRSAQPHLNAEQLRCTGIPNLAINEQDKIASKISELSYSIKSTIKTLSTSKSVFRNLINQIFS